MKGIRILLVDNHELFRQGVRSMLEQEKDMEIVGDCSSAEEALFQTDALSPNIILMDTKLPGIGGIEATRRLRQRPTPCNVIMLTPHDDYLTEALEAGAAGYLLEDIKYQELIQAIRSVYHGELVIDERLTTATRPSDKESEHPLPEGKGFDILNREVTLVIPPPVNASQLLKFVYQIEKVFQATILQNIGDRDKGTTITILLRETTPLTTILDKLYKIAEVQDVREKSMTKYRLLNFSKQIIARPENRPLKELLVTLKQAETAKQLESAGHSHENLLDMSPHR